MSTQDSLKSPGSLDSPGSLEEALITRPQVQHSNEGFIPPPPSPKSRHTIAKLRKRGLSAQQEAECADLYRLVCERLFTNRDKLTVIQLERLCSVLAPDPYQRVAALLAGIHPTGAILSLREGLAILESVDAVEPSADTRLNVARQINESAPAEFNPATTDAEES
jgi:hypothetical protein